jgi:DNA-binding NtrC family response regulator
MDGKNAGNKTMLQYNPTQNVIIFSESHEGRDYLRSRIAPLGVSAVCFEKEAICFDNFRSIAPKCIIVKTDAAQIVRRFVFAAHALQLESPLVVVSENLKADAHLTHDAGICQDAAAAGIEDLSLAGKIQELFGGSQLLLAGPHLPLFIGKSAAIRNVRSQMADIADLCDPVLITGESGSGKELVVRLIHQLARKERSLIKIDCGELQPEMLINGWLDEAIATGAASKPATLFFSDIHLASKEIQSEILLVIDRVERCRDRQKGAGILDARVIAACEPVIQERLRNDGFKKELFFRLNVMPVQVPPLRDRKDDIPLLMEYFLIKACADGQRSILIPSQKARDALYMYHWPANVNELKSYMRRVAAAGNESCILDNYRIPKLKKNSREYFLQAAGAEDLPKIHEIKNSLSEMPNLSLKKVCEAFVARTEKKLMQRALESTNWNRKKAAQLLNISYKSLLNKIKVYDIV